MPRFKPPKFKQRNHARLLFGRGLSDVEIARRLKVSPSSVGRWRRAEGVPPTVAAASKEKPTMPIRSSRVRVTAAGRAAVRPGKPGGGLAMAAELLGSVASTLEARAETRESAAGSVVLLLGGCAHSVRGVPGQRSGFCPRCKVTRDVWRQLRPGERPF